MYNRESANRIKTWDRLKNLLKRNKITSKHERQVLIQLQKIQQTGTVRDYNITFDKLIMQISELSFQVEMHFYLQGLKTELCQMVESNKNNLQDMVTLKQVCLRLDNITNPVGNSGTKAKRIRIQDATLFFSTKNNGKEKNTDDNRNKN